MAAKWQQWMPLHIDRFFGSPAVQAMHPTAQMGYLRLLAACWQSEDCTVPADPIDLAEKSGLGDDMWAQFGPRILRKFERVDGNGHLRNLVCYEEWKEAKRVFDSRREAAAKTNSARSANGHRAVTDDIAVRSADTRTTVVPVVVNVPVSVRKEPDDDLEPEMVAVCLGELLGISIGCGPGSMNAAVTEVAAAEKKRGKSMKELQVEMEGAYRFYEQEKPGLRIQWGPAKFFGDGHWRTPESWPRKQKTRSEEISTWRAKDDDEGA